ncbi:mucin-5AC-like [Acanthaster planci]|uniref:Mucin-5AC-like n=1 Tax=Acanthaster planci TaxID=133434 RepID=A0A8B7ZCI3_ACAPL|nr:mucin-5AC-like [Acanthaster planci]
MMAFWGLFIPLLGVMGVGLGFPTGAPATVCMNMTPGHRDTVAMDTASPYRLVVDDSIVAPGGVITVTLTSREESEVTFRGFLLQARRANDEISDAVGQFTYRDSNNRIKTLACNGRVSSALTHNDRGQKRTLQARWTAPWNVEGPVHFVATVVKSVNEYWLGITSPIVNIIKQPLNPRSTPEAHSSTILRATSSTDTKFDESTTVSSRSTMGEPHQETKLTSTETSRNRTSSQGVTSVTANSTTVSEATTHLSSITLSNLTHSSNNFTHAGIADSTTLSEGSMASPTVTSSLSITNNAESSTSSPEETSTQPAQAAHSTIPLITTLARTVSTISSSATIFESTSIDTNTPSAIDFSSSTSSDSRILSTAELMLNVTNVSGSTTHTDSISANETEAVNDFFTTQPGEFHTTDSIMETTTTRQAFNEFETSTLTVQTPMSSQHESTTVSNTTEDTVNSSAESSTLAVELSTQPTNLSSELSVTSSENSSAVHESTPTSFGLSTSLPDATVSGRHNNTSTRPLLASTEPLVDTVSMSYDVSTSHANVSSPFSTTVSTPSNDIINTSTATAFPSPVSTTALEMTTTLSDLLSNTQGKTPRPSDDNFVTDAVNTTETIKSSTETAPPYKSPTHALTTTEEITQEFTNSTREFDTSATPSPETTNTIGETESPAALTLLSTSIVMTRDSTSEPMMATIESTTVFSTTSGSMSLQPTHPPTISTSNAGSEQATVRPEMSTPYVINEKANEIRLRVSIEGVPFTDNLKDPTSESFMRIAGQVEKEISDLYRREAVTTIDCIKVLRITQGSIVPEVQMLATGDLDWSTKSAWLSVMYNEVQNNGRLGNFTVSGISAVTSDGTFVEVDPCFLLPCPVSMVCYVYQSSCFSSCRLNQNYCLNGGICQEPTGNKQLVSCRCDSSHEGVRCDVRKEPVSPSPNEVDNSHVIVAAVWGSIGSVCFVLIIIFSSWLIRRMRKKRQWRHTAKLMGNTEMGLQSRERMDSFARRLTSIRAGVLIDLANISLSGSEGDSTETGSRQLSRATSFSGEESVDHPRFIEGGVHIGGMPDILQGASTTDYELDLMNRPLNQKRKSVSFNDVTEMIDFVATENFTLGNQDGTDGNFQVRWDFKVDRSDSQETDS